MAIDPPKASQTALAKLAGDLEEPLVREEAINQASSGTSTVPDQGGSLCGCIDLSDLRFASRIDEASTPKAEQLEMLAPLDVRRTLWRTCSHLLSAGLIRGIDEVAAGRRMGSPSREAHPRHRLR